MMIYNDIEIFKLLINANADINVKNNQGMTILMYAASKYVSLNILNALLQIYPKNKINERDNKGKTALMYASKIDKINLLLKYGADIHVKDDQGQNVLWYAKDKKIIKFYLENGINKNEKNDKGESLLFYYVNDYTNDMLENLINLGFDVNLRDSFGNTPLIICHNIICQDLLLNNNADINAVNNAGHNALTVNILREFPNESVIYNLVKKGINVNQIDVDGFTPLFYALSNNEEKIAKYLIKAGADVNTDKIKSMHNIVITNNQ